VQPTSGERVASYARTVVEILRPESVSLTVRSARDADEASWPWPTDEPVHILTAWDPGAERPGRERNRMRQQALESDLAQMAVPRWAAVGVDAATGRREEGVAVRGIPEAKVLALGARYAQDAIFTWTPGAWAIVACEDGWRLASGWSLVTPVFGGCLMEPGRSLQGPFHFSP
jgi:hypothetical protein